MASDLISRDDALELLNDRWYDRHGTTNPFDMAVCDVMVSLIDEVERVKAVDAIEVVRCKDCKWRGNVDKCPMTYYEYIWDDRSGGLDEDKVNKTDDDGFCHRGVKKDAVD